MALLTAFLACKKLIYIKLPLIIQQRKVCRIQWVYTLISESNIEEIINCSLNKYSWSCFGAKFHDLTGICESFATYIALHAASIIIYYSFKWMNRNKRNRLNWYLQRGPPNFEAIVLPTTSSFSKFESCLLSIEHWQLDVCDRPTGVHVMRLDVTWRKYTCCDVYVCL